MRMRRLGWIPLVAAVLMMTTTGTDARSKRREPRPFALRAQVADTTVNGNVRRRSRQRSFEGYETHTIEFHVYRRRHAEDELPTQVKLYLPNGDLYSAIDLAPIEVAADDRGRRRRRAPVAKAQLRVAGTVITRFGLYGEWRADVCWESGTETSCRRGLSFDIH